MTNFDIEFDFQPLACLFSAVVQSLFYILPSIFLRCEFFFHSHRIENDGLEVTWFPFSGTGFIYTFKFYWSLWNRHTNEAISNGFSFDFAAVRFNNENFKSGKFGWQKPDAGSQKLQKRAFLHFGKHHEPLCIQMNSDQENFVVWGTFNQVKTHSRLWNKRRRKRRWRRSGKEMKRKS